MKFLIALLVVGSTCGVPRPEYYGNHFDLFHSNEFASEEFGVHKEPQFLPQFESQGQHYEDRDFIPSYYPSKQSDAWLNDYQPFAQSFYAQQIPHINHEQLGFPYFVSPKFSGFASVQSGSLIQNISSAATSKNVTMTTASSMNITMNKTMDMATAIPTLMPPVNISSAPIVATSVKPAGSGNLNNGPFLFFRKIFSIFSGGAPTDPVAINMMNITKRII